MTAQTRTPRKTTGQKAAAARTSPAKAAGRTVEDGERLIDIYRRMVLIRRFEERAARGYTQALIGGYCHLNLGEEAAVVGLLSALRPSDYLFTNYREHGYAITRGIDPNRVMAELYGRVDGVSKGWGGSMHMFDIDKRMLGGYGIVGGQIPLATGVALAIDYRGGDDVVLCTMGDGTTNIGAFHESLNIAALWNLPIVYVIINNKQNPNSTSGDPRIGWRPNASTDSILSRSPRRRGGRPNRRAAASRSCSKS
jgi:pyruvate dehydrogenase E1 component alpha subunit